jgi:TolB-like protein/DNA-binding winged helix-turn-helix (wHTH) protein
LSYRFSNIEIDTARREFWRGGAIVHLEPQVFDLLVHLIRHRDRIVSKDELIDAIWEGRIISEATISSRISAARRALGDSGNDQSFIRTLYKRGFRFVGDVDEGSSVERATTIETAPPPDGAPEATALVDETPMVKAPPLAASPAYDLRPEPTREQLFADLSVSLPYGAGNVPVVAGYGPASRAAGGVATWLLREKTLLLGAAAMTLTALSLAAVSLSSRWQWSEPAVRGALAPAGELEVSAEQRAPVVPSIVVLPFINLGGDAKDDYVADGITDSLTSDLARALPGISVVSRDTAFTYRGRSVDVRDIARDLSVEYVLEGSVVLEGERVRVNIQLVKAKEGGQLWADRFDIERRSILQVQDEIVGRASRAIGLKVVDIEARRSRNERPSSTEVVDLILRGRAVLNLPSSPATMIEARDLFEQALTVQPNNVDALAGVATTLVFEFVNGYYETGGAERLQRAEALLDQASALEPRHLMVLKAKAALRRAQGKFNDAIAAAEAIIMENPGEPWAYKEIGLSTLYLGDAELALDWFAKAERIGPRDPGRWTWLDARGHALILLGRDEEALRALVSARDANPKNMSTQAFLAAAYGLLGRSEEARAALAAYLHSRPGARISTFRRNSPVPLVLTSDKYQQQRVRVSEGLRKAGMPE